MAISIAVRAPCAEDSFALTPTPRLAVGLESTMWSSVSKRHPFQTLEPSPRCHLCSPFPRPSCRVSHFLFSLAQSSWHSRYYLPTSFHSFPPSFKGYLSSRCHSPFVPLISPPSPTPRHPLPSILILRYIFHLLSFDGPYRRYFE